MKLTEKEPLLAGVRHFDMTKERVSLALNPDVLREIEERRGWISRSVYVELLLRRALEEPDEELLRTSRESRIPPRSVVR
jgi:hypothetical protein